MDTNKEETVITPQPEFHDYIGEKYQMSADGNLAEASKHISYLEQLVENLTISRFGLHRFADNPKLVMFYTGFSSYSLLMNIFHLLKPTAVK